MIHEILFYLWRCPENSEATNLFELNDFLHPGEKKLLSGILEIGMNYHQIVAFTKSILNNQTCLNDEQQISANSPKGLYICAFCSGVDSVLESYRKEIIQLEQKFLQFPQLNITYILSTVEQYRDLFDMLKSIINVIKADELHGCLLVGRLQKYVYHGIDKRNLAAEIIIRSLNKLFYGHLCNWIIYGNIDDINNEFFIRDAKCMDENFLYPHQLMEQNNSETTATNALFKKTRISSPPLVRKFFIDWSMVPMFVDPDIAESILFMGRIVWIVKNDPKKLTDDKYEIKYKHDIWDGKAIEYYSKIEDFQTEPFNIVQFKAMIEECRIKITKYLWSVMTEQGNLIEHLQLVRDYYALGRGELFQQFLTVAENHLKDTTTDHIIQNLNFIFMEISRNIYGENDKTHSRFELVLSKETTSTNPFSKLQIKFEIKWPLHIIFHPKAMELYNQLFCYLLRIKKTQINLHKLWQRHISNKQKVDKRVWVLRQNLIFLVNNLQYYLQVDVIEAQFSILLKAVKNANEFEDIIKVHNDFISNLLSKTFVLTSDEEYVPSNKHSLYQVPALQCDVPSKVYNAIVCLLDTCDNFCFEANTWGEELREPDVAELEGFQKKTDIIVESLSLILNSLHEKAKGQHLLQLLYQLDFNKYFSNNKSEFSLYPKKNA